MVIGHSFCALVVFFFELEEALECFEEAMGSAVAGFVAEGFERRVEHFGEQAIGEELDFAAGVIVEIGHT